MKKEKSLEDQFIDALDNNRCVDCGDYKEDVKQVSDPESYFRHDAVVLVMLCHECLRERCRNLSPIGSLREKAYAAVLANRTPTKS